VKAVGEGGISNVRVIMMIMCVIMVKSLCQAAMRQVPVLQCLLPGARGRLRLCAIMPVI
jgi:hypothetical protein